MQNKLTIILPADSGEFREEDQLHHASEIGIDFGDTRGDYTCNVIIEKSESGLIIKTNNQFRSINAFRSNNNNNEIELRVSEK